jgi:hypothetical protein
MPRGKKPGAPKTGGRRKGSKNKRTKLLDEKAAEGILPLDFALQIMRDPKEDKTLRVECMKAAFPYLHARRAPEDKHGDTVSPIQYITDNLESE